MNPTYDGYNFVYDNVYTDAGSQLYEARRINQHFYLSMLIEMDRLSNYNGGNTYIYVPIPTSIKNILSTEYPPIIGNNITGFVSRGEIVPQGNPDGKFSVAFAGSMKYDAPGYEGTHIRVEFKDSNINNKVLGRCICWMEIRFAPRVI